MEEKCYEDMMTKFGRPVDLEALQTLSGNRKLEELRQRKVLTEIDQDKEVKEWDVRTRARLYARKKSFWDTFLSVFFIVLVCSVQAKVSEEHQALLAVIKRNTELLHASSRLIEEKRQLNEKIRGRQTGTVTPAHVTRSPFGLERENFSEANVQKTPHARACT